MSLRDLESATKRLIMTAGKGGVGKTTCAAAIATRFADGGHPTLIVSSDPTPSLSDIFGVDIGPKETQIPGAPRLTALEVDSEIILARWKEKFGPEMYEVISSFLPFDETIIDYVATAPGIEEEYMLDFILEIVTAGRYDVVVWDTAPAGHTLKLLDMPNMFVTHLTQAMRVYMGFTDYVKKVQDVTKRKPSRRRIMDIIRSWEALSIKVSDFLKDPDNTEFVLVTIPEALGVKQSERIIKAFDDYGLEMRRLVVNNVIGESDNEFLASRRRMQQGYLTYLKETYAGRLDVQEVPLAPGEIQGLERIRQVAKILFSSS
jgi:arsenite/tail-anchored protein-transporting ATPase